MKAWLGRACQSPWAMLGNWRQIFPGRAPGGATMVHWIAGQGIEDGARVAGRAGTARLAHHGNKGWGPKGLIRARVAVVERGREGSMTEEGGSPLTGREMGRGQRRQRRARGRRGAVCGTLVGGELVRSVHPEVRRTLRNA